MHLHAIATLKVVIGTTHTDDGLIDKENNMITNGHAHHESKEANGHLTAGREGPKSLPHSDTSRNNNSDGNDNVKIKVTDTTAENGDANKEDDEEDKPVGIFKTT